MLATAFLKLQFMAKCIPCRLVMKRTSSLPLSPPFTFYRWNSLRVKPKTLVLLTSGSTIIVALTFASVLSCLSMVPTELCVEVERTRDGLEIHRCMLSRCMPGMLRSAHRPILFVVNASAVMRERTSRSTICATPTPPPICPYADPLIQKDATLPLIC